MMVDDVINPFLDDEDDAFEDDVDVVGASVSDGVSGENKPWDRDYTDEQRADMQARRDAGEYLPGHKKHTTTYRRRNVTDKDLDLLAFMARLKFSTEQQLTLIANVQRRTVYKRLMGLLEMKLVNVNSDTGFGRIWFTTQRANTILTEAGRITGDDVRLIRQKDITPEGGIGHTLATNQTAAWLMRGMPLSDKFPKWLRMPYTLNALISEYQIRKGWEQLMHEGDRTTYDAGFIGHRRRMAAEQSVKNGELSVREMHDEEPSLWTLSDADATAHKTKQFHYPDLVLNRESIREDIREDSTPVSVAFEIELTPKNRGETERILRMFKNDTTTYRYLVWIVKNDAVERHIMREDRKVGLGDTGRMTVLPIIGPDARRFDGPTWKL